MTNKILDILRNFIRILISYFPPTIYRRMLNISILAHEYPNAFKGKNHFKTSGFANGREALWDFTCEEIGRNSKLIYLEFGVYNGRSLKYFSKNFVNKDSKFIGLDTFEGLPTDWTTAKIPKGSYSTFGKLPDIKDKRESYLFKAKLIGSGVNSRNYLGQISNRNCLFKIQPL